MNMKKLCVNTGNFYCNDSQECRDREIRRPLPVAHRTLGILIMEVQHVTSRTERSGHIKEVRY